MRTIICFLLLLPVTGFSQLSIGVKGGLNFANITDASGFNNSNRTGYMIGGFIAPKPKKLLGFRSEIILSRQGYDYKTNTNSGNVNLDYLLLPQLITLNFTKKLEIHAGGQAAFLLNAKVDSTGGTGNGNGSLFDYFNRFDYGLAGGVQVSPLFGLFFGARINISLNNLNKERPSGSDPNFVPREYVKNNVVQLYAGWRF